MLIGIIIKFFLKMFIFFVYVCICECIWFGVLGKERNLVKYVCEGWNSMGVEKGEVL